MKNQRKPLTNPANIYILYDSKIILRKYNKYKGDKTMKKVLLTSAVALAAFGAVQAVSADIPDFEVVLKGIADRNTKEEAKKTAESLRSFQYYTLTQQTFQGKTLYQYYKNFLDAEKKYKELPETLKATLASYEALLQEDIKLKDIEADKDALNNKLEELKKAIDKAEHQIKPDILSHLDSINKDLAEADSRVAMLREKKFGLEFKYTAAVKVAEGANAQVDKEIEIELEKNNNELATALKTQKELAEKLAEKLAEQKENDFNILRYKAAEQAVIAYQAGETSKIYEASYGFKAKIDAAKAAVEKLKDEVEMARKERDAAKASLESAETAVAKAFKEKGLTYNRSVFEPVDTATNTVKVGWYKNHAGMWSYYSTAGDKATGWKQVDGTWYYFNAAGEMQKFWVKDGNTWYYLNGSGELVTGWLQDGGKWYFLDASGAMKASQWIQNNGSWYYLDATGAMKANGWFQVGDKWYYATASGAIAVNTTVGGYTVNGNGEWVK